jgi:superfamily I DNA and/or RNA helicase
MHPSISDFPASAFYRLHENHQSEAHEELPSMFKPLEKLLPRVVFFDLKSSDEVNTKGGDSITNFQEAELTAELI